MTLRFTEAGWRTLHLPCGNPCRDRAGSASVHSVALDGNEGLGWGDKEVDKEGDN